VKRLLQRLKGHGLREPAPLPEIPKEVDEGTGHAFCPLLHEENGRGFCGDVACHRCALVEARYFDHRRMWLCSVCARGQSAEPYWGSGACDSCGHESPALVLVLR